MFCRKFFVPLLLPGEISLSFKCTTRMSFPMCISLTPSRKSRKMCSALALQSHHRHRAVLAKHLKTNKQTNTHTHNRTQSSKSRVLVGNGCQFLQCKFSHMAAAFWMQSWEEWLSQRLPGSLGRGGGEPHLGLFGDSCLVLGSAHGKCFVYICC